MSLTIGKGPFGQQPAGRFDFDPPEHVVYVEDFPRRVHAIKDGKTVIDSTRVKLVHESGRLPRYSFAADDVEIDASPDPRVEGHVHVPWDRADAWFEEDEQVFVHVRDPYHRIDTVTTSRLVRVSLDGITLAETTAAKALYETGLPIRYYLPLGDVQLELLRPSDHVTQCAYKGTAQHWSAEVGGTFHADVAWAYGDREVWPEGEPVRGRICFYNERTDIEIDGVRSERPATPWAR
jgi:uncharacterized protein (DUF427 family)